MMRDYLEYAKDHEIVNTKVSVYLIKRIGRELNPIRWDLQSHASPLCHLSVLHGIFNGFINFGLLN